MFYKLKFGPDDVSRFLLSDNQSYCNSSCARASGQKSGDHQSRIHLLKYTYRSATGTILVFSLNGCEAFATRPSLITHMMATSSCQWGSRRPDETQTEPLQFCLRWQNARSFSRGPENKEVFVLDSDNSSSYPEWKDPRPSACSQCHSHVRLFGRFFVFFLIPSKETDSSIWHKIPPLNINERSNAASSATEVHFDKLSRIAPFFFCKIGTGTRTRGDSQRG